MPSRSSSSRPRELLGQPGSFEPQIDEARPGDLGRLAQIGHVEPADQFGGHVAWAAAEPFAQRHRQIGLIVAKRAILCRPHHVDQLGQLAGVGDQGFKCRIGSGLAIG